MDLEMKEYIQVKDFLMGSLFFVLLLACNSPDVRAQQAVESPGDTLVVQGSSDTLSPEQADTLLCIIGVGDMMLGTNYPSAGYLPPNGGKDILVEVTPIIQTADLAFGNLEGAILDQGGTPKTCKNPDVCYVFRSPESYAQHFADAGFHMLSLANNHSGDFGPEGRKRTKASLDAVGIAYAGLAGTDEYCVVERNGIRYGMAAFAPNVGTCDIRDIPRAKEIVRTLKEKSDIVIVSFHGGAEGPQHQHVPKATETYYGENRGDVHKFAHAVIDAGADIVFGHGPHVTRAIELYNDRLIAYSLGNFATYGRFNLSGPAGLAPLLKVYVDAQGRFVHGEIVATYQTKPHGPKIDPQKRVIKDMIRLTKADFPDTPLLISEDGLITRTQGLE
jgi:hypothetical protein